MLAARIEDICWGCLMAHDRCDMYDLRAQGPVAKVLRLQAAYPNFSATLGWDGYGKGSSSSRRQGLAVTFDFRT